MDLFIFMAVLIIIFVLSVICMLHGIKNLKTGLAFSSEHKVMRISFTIFSVLQIISGSLIVLCYLIVTLLIMTGGN